MHEIPQTPAAHTAVPFGGSLHFVSHPPQCAASLSRRRQTLPHLANGESHFMPHFPSEHVAPPFTGTGQACPQVPQLAMFDEKSTQAELHGLVPVGHVLAQAPAEHTSPAPQRRPQAPQLEGSV